MDVTGVLLCAAGVIVGLTHVVQDIGSWRAVTAVRRSGRPTVANVVDNESYRRLDIRSALQRPVVEYRVGERTYRSTLENHLGAAPVSSGVAVLADPDVPLMVVAADRHDARNQLALSVACTVIALGAGLYLVLGA